jgi:N-acetylglucosamine kinase-like BadF-type ATPase
MIINQLLSTKMIKVKGNNKNVFGGRGYVLTDAGAEKAEKLIHQLSPDIRQKMELLKTTTNHMGLTGMVQFIYSNHPEYVFLPDGGEHNV